MEYPLLVTPLTESIQLGMSVAIPDYQMVANEDIHRGVAEIEGEFVTTLITLKYVSSASQSTAGTDTSSSVGSFGDFILDTEVNKAPICALRSIVERMNSAGYLGQCVQAYKSVRKPFVDGSLKKLGFEKLGARHIRNLPWEELRIKNLTWIQATEFCLEVLFPREKQLAEEIFDGFGTDTYVECFVETVKDVVIQLYKFAERLSSTGRSPQKLFHILEVYKRSSRLSLYISVFSRAPERIGCDFGLLLPLLEEVVKGILSDFENAVLHELLTISDEGGGTHRLTRYVMRYICVAAQNYGETLTNLIVSGPSSTSCGDQAIPHVEFSQLKGRTPLALHFILSTVFLQFNLEGKSRCYKDASLGHLFMANNIHFILMSITDCQKLREMVGEDYLNKLIQNKWQAVISYGSTTCHRMLYYLSDKRLHYVSCWCFSFVLGSSRKAWRKRIEAFNSMFEEVQQKWAVSADWNLRGELLQSVSGILVPAYKSFLARSRTIHTKKGSNNDFDTRFIKYSVEDLQALIFKNFLGYMDEHSGAMDDIPQALGISNLHSVPYC